MKEEKKVRDDKAAARHTFDALPRSMLLKGLWQFVRKPDIVGETPRDSALQYAGRNCLISILVLLPFVALVEQIVPGIFAIDLTQLFNPFWLSMTLGAQVLLFAATLACIGSLALLPKGVRFHRLLGYQAVQVYAVINFPFIVMLAIAADRAMHLGDMRATFGTADLLFGGALAVLVFYLAWRLLFRPVARYMARYYRKSVAALLAVVVFGCTFTVNAYTSFGFGDLAMRKEGLCQVFYEIGRKNGKIEASVDEACFVGQCIVKADGED